MGNTLVEYGAMKSIKVSKSIGDFGEQSRSDLIYYADILHLSPMAISMDWWNREGDDIKERISKVESRPMSKSEVESRHIPKSKVESRPCPKSKVESRPLRRKSEVGKSTTSQVKSRESTRSKVESRKSTPSSEVKYGYSKSVVESQLLPES
jgi:hypothetical protein